MKTLLRISALTATLALSVFATTGRADVYGTCRTGCFNPSTHKSTVVAWNTTAQECCYGTFNPCPEGSEPTGAVSFQPAGGSIGRCL